jgi:ribosome biogenesis GTPase
MKGLVVKSTGSWYKVRKENGVIIECRLKGKFRIQGLKVTNPVSVGDWVDFDEEGGKETGVIKGIDDRKNYIIRTSVNLSKQSHIIASNVDQAILIATIIQPQTKLEFIDRFLVTASAYNIPVTILINKLDVYSENELEILADWAMIYEEAGINLIPISVEKEINLDKVDMLLKDKVSVVSGNSGVGKSSLLNKISSDFELRTSEISEAHEQGVHTTTFAEMFELPEGGFVIDTPGIRGLGIVDIEQEELGNFFPEILRFKPDCKFNNCVHVNEPKCAVKTAVESGDISEERYNSYLSIYNNDETENYR